MQPVGCAYSTTRHDRPYHRKATLVYIILMGAQGSGKGTQAALLAPRCKLVKIATGDLFRAAIKDETPLGQQVKAILDRGDLVPDEITNAIVQERITAINAEIAGATETEGALFDGYPRNRSQAETLDGILAGVGENLTLVVQIDVPHEVLIDRLSSRAQTEQREDDTPETIARRLEVYAEQTAPLLDYYDQRGLLARVDGSQDIETVHEAIVREVEARATLARVT